MRDNYILSLPASPIIWAVHSNYIHLLLFIPSSFSGFEAIEEFNFKHGSRSTK